MIEFSRFIAAATIYCGFVLWACHSLIFRLPERRRIRRTGEISQKILTAQALREAADRQEPTAEDRKTLCGCVLCSHKRIAAELDRSARPIGAEEMPQVVFAEGGGAWVVMWAPAIDIPKTPAELAASLDRLAISASRAAANVQPAGAGGKVH